MTDGSVELGSGKLSLLPAKELLCCALSLTRVEAMRMGTTLSYLFGDHLGSTSITADASGVVSGQLRYLPFGSTRYLSAALRDFARAARRRPASALRLN